MDTKYAIKKLKKVAHWPEINTDVVELDVIEADQIISLLKRGEKFEAIVEELEEEAIAGNNFVVPEEFLAKQGGVMEYLIKTLKEKYFPKPIKKIITISLVANEEKIKDWIGWFHDANQLKCNESNIDYAIKEDN